MSHIRQKLQLPVFNSAHEMSATFWLYEITVIGLL